MQGMKPKGGHFVLNGFILKCSNTDSRVYHATTRRKLLVRVSRAVSSTTKTFSDLSMPALGYQTFWHTCPMP